MRPRRPAPPRPARRLAAITIGLAACLATPVAASATPAAGPDGDAARANAPTCRLGFTAPSGGGRDRAPIEVTGRIACSSRLVHSGARLSVGVVRDNIQIAERQMTITGRTTASLTVTAACDGGGWFHTLVTATTPGADLFESFVTSDYVSISCGDPGRPPICETNPAACARMTAATPPSPAGRRAARSTRRRAGALVVPADRC